MKITLKGTKNTRSLSDLINVEGKSIKPHLLIRSDALNKLTAEDKTILKERYNLKRVIDLRCENETFSNPDVLIEGVEIVYNPILPNERVGITKKGNEEEDFKDFVNEIKRNGSESSIQFMKKVYKEIIALEFSNLAYQRFIKLLLEDVGGATLWHCSAGKDRAGFATFLLLYLLDFKYENIVQDYLKTNQYYESEVKRFVDIYGEGYRETLQTVFGVREDYIDTIMAEIKELYGDLDTYIEKGLKITSMDKEKLKNLYLEERIYAA